MMKAFQKDKLTVKAYDTRAEMGVAAAADIKACLLQLLSTQESVNMIFAAAPSQNEVLAALVADKEIPWERVRAFHMDEYIGLPAGAPQAFSNFLNEHIFSHLPFMEVHLINSTANAPEAECARYTALLTQYPTDVVVMGIGENGHVAFNDPPVADFQDALWVKPVALDQICRQQQVNDGCFDTLDAVPKTAITLTVPTLMRGKHLFCVVPAPSKARAVRATLTGEIDEHCPATALRRHESAVLYLDSDSAALL